MSDDQPLPAECNGARLPDGKFAPGNKFGRGNPAHAKARDLRRALLEAATPEKVKEVADMLVTRAIEDRDVTAARAYLEYTIGRPAQAIELSGPDGDPLGLDWPKVERTILAALEPFGESARFAVAVALRGIVDAGGAEQPGTQA